MHDFGSFCYLDPQKTGTTFVSEFLARHCPDREREFKKHGVVMEKRPDTFYFISARDPFGLYRSLYAYGVPRGGRVRGRLGRQGHAAVYDGTQEGFSAWLDIVLNPENHKLVVRHFSESESALYGLQTHRFWRLAFVNSPEVLTKFRTREDVRDAYATRRLPSVIVRNETLNADLAALIDPHLGAEMADPAAAKAELEEGAKRLNTSGNSSGKVKLTLDDDVRAKIAEREWFFSDVLGYPGAKPPSAAAAPASPVAEAAVTSG